MRSPISPVSAWYARLCLSLVIQVEYSFCKIRLPTTGVTLPWQLVAAQEPGPIYFCGCEESPAEAADDFAAGALPSFFAEAVQTARTKGKGSARHNAAPSQWE